MNREQRLAYMREWNRRQYADPKKREELKRAARIRMGSKYHSSEAYRSHKLRAQKKYNQANRAKIGEYQKKYKQKNRSKLNAYQSQYQKARYATDPAFREKKKAGMRRLYATKSYRAKANAYRAVRKKTDPTFRIIEAQRRRIRDALKGINKSAKTMALLGCTVEYLRSHLQSLFKPGMTWDNYGYRGWHVDHVKPVALFDMTDETHQRAAFHFSNLQPLWIQENQSKGCRFPA